MVQPVHPRHRLLCHLVWEYPHSRWSSRVIKKYKYYLGLFYKQVPNPSQMRSAKSWWVRTAASPKRWLKLWTVGSRASRAFGSQLQVLAEAHRVSQANALLLGELEDGLSDDVFLGDDLVGNRAILPGAHRSANSSDQSGHVQLTDLRDDNGRVLRGRASARRASAAIARICGSSRR